ncbi:MAG: response regulator, partial [Planctomycetes bacterium]|nr:response regulator [Planctomycetota bacterium]
QYMKKEGWEIRTATSGPIALELASDWSPDIVLLDIMMPGMSGFEVCGRLKADDKTKECTVIFLTANTRTDILIQGLELGAEDFLRKPVEGVELLARIRSQLRLRSYRQELERQAALFRRFVPPDFLDYLKNAKGDISIGSMREDTYSILFADIRGFCAFSDQFTASESLGFLNAFFSRMEPAVTAFKGVIDKYLGDGLMALFRIVEGKPLSGDACIHAAIKMQEDLLIYNRSRIKQGFESVAMGIGVNTGKVALGLTGTDKRMDSTAIGRAVNMASRAEQLTKQYRCSIIITESTLESLSESHPFLIRKLGSTEIRGLTGRISIFEVFTGDRPELRQEKEQTLESMNEAVDLLESQRFEQAIRLFSELAKRSVYDPLPEVMYHEAVQRRSTMSQLRLFEEE